MSPAPGGVLTDPDVTGDRSVRNVGGGSKHNPGAENVAVRTAGGVRALGQDTTFFIGEDHDISTGWSHIHF
jgi:hypothetical protein